MTILPRKGLLAIAAVVEVALQTDGRPISAKTLATRHGLPPRHLELVLQSLVRDGILKGTTVQPSMATERVATKAAESLTSTSGLLCRSDCFHGAGQICHVDVRALSVVISATVP
jgi:DNA-binding Lrp family transcriptional regulator